MKKMHSTAHAFVSLLGSGFVVQCLILCGVIVLSRFYGPDSFGDFGFYSGLASIVAIVAGLRFDYIGFSQSGENKAVFFAVSLVNSVAVVLAILLIMIVAGQYLGIGPERCLLTFVFCLSASVFYLATQYLIAKSEYGVFAYLRFFQAISQVLLGVALYEVMPSYGLVVAFVVSQFAAGGIALVLSWKSISSVSTSSMLSCWGEYNGRALANVLVSLLQYSTPFAPTLIAAFFFTKSDIGAYFLLAQAVTAPLAVFRRSFINFLNGEVFGINQANSLLNHYGQLVRRLVLGGFVLLIIGALVIHFYGAALIGVVFGSNWVGYAPLLLPIFVYFVLDALLQPITTLLPLWGFHRLAIGYEFIRFCLVFLIVPLFLFFTDIGFMWFLIMYFSAMFAVYILTLIAVYRKMQKGLVRASY